MARIAVLMCLVALLVTLPARAGAAHLEAPYPTSSFLTIPYSVFKQLGSDGRTLGAMSTHRKLLGDNRMQQRCRRIYSRWCR
jgi:hypothetical protein